MRRLIEGGAYSEAALIRVNTVFASHANLFRELAFCEIFLGSIGFLYVYDKHFALKNTRRVLGRVLGIKIFSLIREMFDKTRARGEEYDCGCII